MLQQYAAQNSSLCLDISIEIGRSLSARKLGLLTTFKESRLQNSKFHAADQLTSETHLHPRVVFFACTGKRLHGVTGGWYCITGQVL